MISKWRELRGVVLRRGDNLMHGGELRAGVQLQRHPGPPLDAVEGESHIEAPFRVLGNLKKHEERVSDRTR